MRSVRRSQIYVTIFPIDARARTPDSGFSKTSGLALWHEDRRRRDGARPCSGHDAHIRRQPHPKLTFPYIGMVRPERILVPIRPEYHTNLFARFDPEVTEVTCRLSGTRIPAPQRDQQSVHGAFRHTGSPTRRRDRVLSNGRLSQECGDDSGYRRQRPYPAYPGRSAIY